MFAPLGTTLFETLAADIPASALFWEGEAAMHAGSSGRGWTGFAGPALLCAWLSAVFAVFLMVTLYLWTIVLPVLLTLVTCIAAGYLWRGDKSRALAAVLTIPCTAALTLGGGYLCSLL